MVGDINACSASSAPGQAFLVLKDWDSVSGDQAWIEEHARVYREQLRALSVALSKGAKSVRTATNTLLNSVSGRVCCFVKAARQRDLEFSRQEIEVNITSLHPRKHCDEPLRVHAIPKTTKGKVRWTVELGVQRLCLNYLLWDLLYVSLGKPTLDYNWSRRGTHRAVEQLMDRVRIGDSWIGRADVKDCYPSFRQEGLAKRLKLPEDVVRNTLTISEDTLLTLPDGSTVPDHIRDTLRRGLPQGTPTSVLISAHLLADVVRPVAMQEWLLLYADNMVWAGGSKAEADAILNALKQSFGSTSVGELTLHDIKITHSDQGADYLGYRVKTYLDKSPKGYAMRASPQHKQFDAHWERLRKAMACMPTGQRHDFALEETAHWLNLWTCYEPSIAKRGEILDQALAVASATH